MTSRKTTLRLAAVVNASMDAVLVADADGRIVLFNPAAERIFRCLAGEAIGKPMCRFIPPTLKQCSPAARAHASDPARPRAASRIGLARRSNGEEFCAEAVTSPIEGSEAAGCVVTLRDVSDRRRNEHTLRSWSRALASTSDAVFVTDRNGIIEYVNRSFAELMGITPDEAVGQRPNIFKSGEQDDAFYKQLWRTLLAGHVYRGILVDRARDGRLIHLEQTITPLTDDEGHITHFVSTGRDVTSRVRAEAALRRLNEAFERQAREISQALHDEAGQLLTSAYIALAKAKGELPRSAYEHLQALKNHLDDIEEQLRRLAHELRPQILDDLGLVPALKFLADGIAQRSGISVRVESTLTGRLPELIETTIYRVGQEALANARRHASADRVTLSLAREPRALRCTVVDDGVGYDAGKASNGTRHEGMGLQGMRDRIEALRGTMHVQSACGKGTRLTVTIPLED